MKHGTVSLLKFKVLARRLRLPLWQAVGLLESLWLFAQHNARDGELTAHTAEGVAAWLEWEGDAGELVEALVDTRWLDRAGERLLIHDWDDHKPNWIRGMDASPRTKKRTPRSVSLSVPLSETLGVEPGQSHSDAPPNLTPPNHTQPNTEVASATSLSSAAANDGAAGKPDLQLVVDADDAQDAQAAVKLAAKQLTDAWNKAPGVVPFKAWNDARRKSFRARLRTKIMLDENDRRLWLDAALDVLVKKFPLRITQGRDNDWKPDIDWFLRPNTLTKIIEGSYDWQKREAAAARKPPRKALA